MAGSRVVPRSNSSLAVLLIETARDFFVLFFVLYRQMRNWNKTNSICRYGAEKKFRTKELSVRNFFSGAGHRMGICGTGIGGKI